MLFSALLIFLSLISSVSRLSIFHLQSSINHQSSVLNLDCQSSIINHPSIKSLNHQSSKISLLQAHQKQTSIDNQIRRQFRSSSLILHHLLLNLVNLQISKTKRKHDKKGQRK